VPKELHEIKKFMTGTISSPSETDIPDDAASYSKNLDAIAEDGKLKGIADDTFLDAELNWVEGESNAGTIAATGQLGIINKEGEKALVYFEDGVYKVIKDMFGPTSSKMDVGIGLSPTTMANNNRELHIGTSGSAKWLGWVDNHQFHEHYHDISLEDAALRPPGALSPVDRAVQIGNATKKLYALRRGHTSLYRFGVATSEFDGEYAFDQTFTSLQAILPDKNDVDSLWVLDRTSVGIHSLYHVDFSEGHDAPAVFLVTLLNMPDDIRDMAQTNDNLWFSRYIPQTTPLTVSGVEVELIYRIATPTEAASGVTPTDVTWDFAHGVNNRGCFTKPVSHDIADTFANVSEYNVEVDRDGVTDNLAIFTQTSSIQIRVDYRTYRNQSALSPDYTITADTGYTIHNWELDTTNQVLIVSFWNGEDLLNTNAITKLKSYSYSMNGSSVTVTAKSTLSYNTTDGPGDIATFALNTHYRDIILPNHTTEFLNSYPDGDVFDVHGCIHTYASDGTITQGTAMSSRWTIVDGTWSPMLCWGARLALGSACPVYFAGNKYKYNTNSPSLNFEELEQNFVPTIVSRPGLYGTQNDYFWYYANNTLYIKKHSSNTSYDSIASSDIVSVGTLSPGYNTYELVVVFDTDEGQTIKIYPLEADSLGNETTYPISNGGASIIGGAVPYYAYTGVKQAPVLVHDDDGTYTITQYEIIPGTDTLRIYTLEDNLMPITDDGNYVGMRFYFEETPYYVKDFTDDPEQTNYPSALAVINNSFTKDDKLLDTNGYLYDTTYYNGIAPGTRIVLQGDDLSRFPTIAEDSLVIKGVNNRIDIETDILPGTDYTPTYKTGNEDDTTLKVYVLHTGGDFTWYEIQYTGGEWTIDSLYESPFTFEVSQTADDDCVFTANTRYYYAASLEYDGYQESPLITEIEGSDADAIQGATPYELELKITLSHIDTLNKRVTALNIYRAENSETTSGTPAGYYRLVRSLPLNIAWTIDDVDHTAEITIYDDGRSYSNYEARTGLPEALNITNIRWDVSAMLNNHHFIANATVEGLYQEQNLLIKSIAYKPNMFHYVYDVLALPATLTALVPFQGRLYGFDENNIYRIDPNGLYIEDVLEGIGCISNKSVVVTDYGMCFADNSNIYFHDGRTPRPIGTPVIGGSSEYAWNNIPCVYKESTVVKFDSNKNTFFVMLQFRNPPDIIKTIAWGYNLERQRWDMIEINDNASNELMSLLAINHADGGLIVAEPSFFRRLFHSSQFNRLWSWTSKKLTLGTDSQDKIFKRTRITGLTANALDSVGTSTGTPTTVHEDDTDNAKYSYSGPARRGKWIQYAIADESGEVDAIGTIFRRRGVK